MARILCILLLSVALCGCTGKTTLDSTHNHQMLPGLPAASGSPGITTPGKGASAQTEAIIHGKDSYAHSFLCAPIGNHLQLYANLGSAAWAIYEVPNIAADYQPVRIDLEFVENNNTYWLALANYDSKSWEYLPGTSTGNSSVTFDSGWEQYRSGTGSLYFAIIEINSSCTFELARVTLEDTRPLPAPTGLTGTPLAGAARLDWDEYLDPRADTIKIYQASDLAMSDAVEISMFAATAVTKTISGLNNGTPYYFAITTYWNAEPLESGYSNVVEVTPDAGSAITLSGLWPRRGNLADNRGCTTNSGPPGFTDYESHSLTARVTPDNRTTPVIGNDGRVYALTGDAELQCLSGDLTTTHWTFQARTHGTPGGIYLSPPHSPILDSNGDCYFVAALSDTGEGTPYLFSVDSDGNMNWRYALADLPDSVDLPYPTPTITADGWIVVCHNRNSTVAAINPQTESEEWSYTIGGGEIHGDFALSSNNHIQVPVWHTGVGIPESLWRFISLDADDGSVVVGWQDMGAPQNVHGGLSIPGDMFIYPQSMRLELIDALTATELDYTEYLENQHSPPARNVAGDLIYQLHPPFGFSGFSNLNFITLDLAAPTPSVTDTAGISLHASSVNCQPAVDGDGVVFVATNDGTLYRIEFDPALPISPENPQATDQTKLDPTDTYMYNSFAIGNEAAYIITEGNTIYCAYNALDD